jgi:hypothetical protein
MSKQHFRDEEALSTEEINRVNEERRRLIKKIFMVLLSMTFFAGLGYFISSINWMKIINDHQKAKKANMIIVDRNLSAKFLDEN